MAYFEALSHHLPGGTGDNLNNPKQDRWSLSYVTNKQNTRNVRYLLLLAINNFLPHAITVKVSDENKLV